MHSETGSSGVALAQGGGVCLSDGRRDRVGWAMVVLFIGGGVAIGWIVSHLMG